MVKTYSLAFAVVLTLAGCATGRQQHLRADVVMEARSQSSVSGTVGLAERHDRVLVHVDLSGLAPNSEHGFHIHDKGDCSAADASSAGGHFNPDQSSHGAATGSAHHAGDLPSLVADATGHVNADFVLENVTLGDGPRSIVGRALIVHRDRDDFVTQPSGNSGARIACGVISLSTANQKHGSR